MDDSQIHGTIEQLVSEEHELWQLEAAGNASDDDRRKLEELKVSLDQCWDLLRQRRAVRAARRRAVPRAGAGPGRRGRPAGRRLRALPAVTACEPGSPAGQGRRPAARSRALAYSRLPDPARAAARVERGRGSRG